MKIGPINLSRSVTSYAKIQHMISAIVRSKRFFVRKKNVTNKVLLNVGCGPHVHSTFINLDYFWMPHIDICWDITKIPYPIASSHLEGIYSEHCLEHISLEDFIRNMVEFYRILKPGGTIRLVVPDGELYMRIYVQKLEGEQIEMPYENEYISPMARINGLFRKYGHQFIGDFDTYCKVLNDVGFVDIKKETYCHGRKIELLIDTHWREIESLYIEATKPE